MTPRRGLLLAAGALGVAFGARSLAAEPVHAYGTKVPFAMARPLRFPDFTIEYVGERRVQSSAFPRGFLYHDFVATSAAERVAVSWSGGTGDIGPAFFTIARRQFGLELARSDALGPLKPGEMVVSPKPAA
jgi:hypothetical protein